MTIISTFVQDKAELAITASKLQNIVTVANRVAAEFNGSRNTCILTSFALHNVLQRLGYNSRPLRIEAAVFPNDRKFYGTILGGWREPGSRQAASPDKWWGHLAVAIENEWLLDPTLDQANKKERPRSMRVGPLAIRLPEKFWAEHGSILIQVNKCSVRFSPHPRQVGFARAVAPFAVIPGAVAYRTSRCGEKAAGLFARWDEIELAVLHLLHRSPRHSPVGQ
jgi:hypothetical protein